MLSQRLHLPGELGKAPNVLLAFIGVHVINDFTATSLPAFLPAIQDDFGLSYQELGLLSLTFALLSGLVQPFIGNFADKKGRRRAVLAAGFVSTALGFVLMGLSPVFGLVLASSLLCGLGGSTYHPQATAFLVKTYPAERGRTLGFHGWGGSIGHFLAPALVAVGVTAVGWRWTAALAAVPSLIAAFGLHRRLEETQPNPGATLRGAATRDLVLMAVTFAALGMVLRGFLAFLPTYLVERGWSLTGAGVLTTMILVVGMFAQPLGGAAFDRVGGRRVILGASIGATGALVLWLLDGGSLGLIGVTIMAFFVFALFPVSLAMASEMAGAERTGAAAGIVFGISGLTGATIPFIIGAIADRSDLRTAMSTLIVLGGVAVLLSLGLPGKVEQPA